MAVAERPTEDWQLRPYRVTLADFDGFTFSVDVTASGARDAANQALTDHPGCTEKRVLAL